jgi:hypothetical protein
LRDRPEHRPLLADEAIVSIFPASLAREQTAHADHAGIAPGIHEGVLDECS